MTTIAIVFLLLLHTRALAPLYRIEVRRDGVWWSTYYESGKGSTLVFRWFR